MNSTISSFARFALVLMMAWGYVMADAEVNIHLRSGESVIGEVILENDEVVILRDAEGARYQYLKSDIESISQAAEVPAETVKTAKERKVGVMVSVSGGAATITGKWGGTVSVDAKIGACNLLNRHIFLGGEIGYHGYVVGQKKYNFLPLQIVADVPFMQTKNAPYAGLSFGYGFGLGKQEYKGGLCGGLEIGWRCAISPSNTFCLALNANVQQCAWKQLETIDGEDYQADLRTPAFWGLGLKVGISF